MDFNGSNFSAPRALRIILRFRDPDFQIQHYQFSLDGNFRLHMEWLYFSAPRALRIILRFRDPDFQIQHDRFSLDGNLQLHME